MKRVQPMMALAVVLALSALVSGWDRDIPVSRGRRLVELSGQSRPAFTQVPAADIGAAIKAELSSALISTTNPLTRREQVELKTLYEEGGHSPLWVDAGGRPQSCAIDALTLLRSAEDDGLDPADYSLDRLDRLVATVRPGSPTVVRDLAAVDVALSALMLRYLHDVHSGRVDPSALGLRLSVPTDHHDFAALLRSAIAGHRLVETVADLRPQFAQYRALRTMLARYRLFAPAAVSAQERLPPLASVVHPGERYAGIDALYRLLATVGDLPGGTAAPAASTAYEGALVEGVRRFQVRHGLSADGVLGKSTQAALRIPLARRVRQIELALERLRWLPHLGDERLVAINSPMFRLWTWDTIPPNGEPLFGMNVIVGRALRTQTPVFVEQLREVVFRPYWNVPPSIARHEIVPQIERNPGYLTRENMEIVSGPGDDAQAVPETAENVSLLRQGRLRVRQRPGPKNALGLVKFVFPNAENVYMHGTPAQELFSRSRRDFSHGCVRVEDPVALAEWALKERPEWTRARILAAMSGTQTIHVSLLQPIRVILFYTTAAVMPDDGTIHFAEDIYAHDAALDRALARGSRVVRPARL
ncbi:MAG TPA: L,D-transpeptidase family protein, partial [Vicinamibacterales bacterium]|nr:L,D-transpeptidase family protein [Vicinamibacterales bacterium]